MAMAERARKTDAQIHHDVIGELKWDSRVHETDVGVEVSEGVVTLTGTVASWAQRQAAQEAARRVIGVLDVANDIAVKVPGGAARTDTEIAQAVRHALEWDVFVAHEQISSTVADGWVTLEGTVERWSQLADAERAVRNLAGVTGVLNLIDVKPPLGADVRHAVEQALERRAEREARRIQIDVHGDVVTLHGTVHSWAERKATVAAARFTPGVRSVDDRLRVEPA
jgi:osmotically-inducible protein OsmY